MYVQLHRCGDFEAKICKANHTQLVAHEKNAFFHNPADHFHLAAMALDMQKKTVCPSEVSALILSETLYTASR